MQVVRNASCQGSYEIVQKFFELCLDGGLLEIFKDDEQELEHFLRRRTVLAKVVYSM